MAGNDMITAAQDAGRRLLTEVESKQLLSEAGIPTTSALLATSREEAIRLSSQIGFPAVLKIASTNIAHKSDVGGVNLNLSNEDDVGRAFDEMMDAVSTGSPGAEIQGVSVQAMARPGIELVMGMSKDPQFGPVIMFGLGGVLVEVLKDVAFRIVPLTPRDAAEMIREIKGFPVLDGYRGQESVDIAALEQGLLQLSRFVDERPTIKELDLNPVFAYSDGLTVVDARIVLEDA
ncbi:MAG: acetyl-CoA synthetase [SAR202 cluster bacterium]|jgi:acyl-CoA synthetase (NDP forming)|nr:acetate--CoA ligase family protein [SAR202 cluster bacterium]MDP6664558.1 acetate--CoA ligase family protein [SAR202 cluster bacterium]MDP6799122.1 acetate--CoA ligase family protein [SAR202 cluster bacterium]MQG59700.1 acetyl-CoA synthetase [SAR202 cluster bacterium]MQG67184.1 acetyl-CoA synthetase [SAR202 cluster bacterium]|tara:strand:- start:30 stop:728 length:699 start_codon:yes stop_codon:yes gene_type:complete